MPTNILSSRLTVSGEAVTLGFAIGPREASHGEHALIAAIQTALDNPTFGTRVEAAAEKRIRKAFGKKYASEPLDVDSTSREVRLTVTAVYVEVVGHKTLPKAAGEAMEEVRRDIREVLTELLPGISANISVRGSWEPGRGVSNDEFIMLPDTDQRELQAGLLRVQSERDDARKYSRASLVVAFGAVPVAAVTGVFVDWAVAGMAGFYLLAGFGGWVIGRSRVLDADAKAAEIENEIELRALPEADELEKRAQKLFKVHAAELKRYYDQTLRQGRYIFYVGLTCLALGFGVIGAAFALIVTTDASELSEKVIIGALGAIGGILANFIAVMYGRMFKETVSAVSGFHERLVLTHHLHFGNFLAAKIDDPNERTKTLALMAAALANVPARDGEPESSGARQQQRA